MFLACCFALFCPLSLTKCQVYRGKPYRMRRFIQTSKFTFIELEKAINNSLVKGELCQGEMG